jgi:hypothetical protein
MVRRAQKVKEAAGPGPGDSVSTVTPQASSSPPRDHLGKEGEGEVYTTPASRSISRTPGGVNGT